MVWKNPDFTPQEIFDTYGSNAARIVMGSAATTEYLITQYAIAGVPYVPPTLPVGVSLTLNQDGTVTVVQA